MGADIKVKFSFLQNTDDNDEAPMSGKRTRKNNEDEEDRNEEGEEECIENVSCFFIDTSLDEDAWQNICTL